MHTYRKATSGGWEVIFQQPDSDTPLGPKFGVEAEAAAYASFLNGGRYCPDEIAHIFAAVDDGEHKENWPEDTYPRPKGMDYEPEAARK